MHMANVPSWILDRIIDGFPELFGSKDAWKGFLVGFQYGRISVFEHIDGDDTNINDGI